MVADAAAWRTWLNGNHAKSQGVRLVLAKKGTTHPTTLSYDEITGKGCGSISPNTLLCVARFSWPIKSACGR